MIIGERDITQRLTPYMTYFLISLNILIFLYEFSLSTGELETLVSNYGEIPCDVLKMNRSYTLITSQFLHGGVLHLFSN